jgi:hypothetical protein
VGRIIVVALLLAVLLVPSVAAAWPVQCWYANETGKLFDWILCGVALVAMQIWDEGPGGYGAPPPE